MADRSHPTADPVVTDHPNRHRYELTLGEERVGLIDYRLADRVMAMTHAEVTPALGGRGLGSALARGALDDARARGLSVRPLCPFVADFIARHPDEYGDLVD